VPLFARRRRGAAAEAEPAPSTPPAAATPPAAGTRAERSPADQKAAGQKAAGQTPAELAPADQSEAGASRDQAVAVDPASTGAGGAHDPAVAGAGGAHDPAVAGAGAAADPAAADAADAAGPGVDTADPVGMAAPTDAPPAAAAVDTSQTGDALGAEASEAADDDVDSPIPTWTGPVGPFPRDVSELGPHEQFLDLGAVRLPVADDVLEGIEIQLQADPETDAVMALLLVDGPEKALELRAFAAPRHETLWDEVRTEIAAEAAAAGGLTQPVVGRWGEELLIQVGVVLADGQQAVQVTRFVGVDGPRWFLRGAFLGRAAIEPATADRLDAVLSGLSVARGQEPMAPRDPLPFAIPGQPAGQVDLPADGGRAPLEPFERGPEIIEIR